MSELKKRKVDFKKIIFACFLKTSILTEKESVCECGQFLSRPKGSATQHEVWLSVYNACTWTIGGQFLKNKIFLLKFFYLKGQSNEIFDPQFFSSFEPAWATDQWVKTVSLLVLFSPRYSYLASKKLTPRSIILRGVKTI